MLLTLFLLLLLLLLASLQAQQQCRAAEDTGEIIWQSHLAAQEHAPVELIELM
jgi:hypothetical protein